MQVDFHRRKLFCNNCEWVMTALECTPFDQATASVEMAKKYITGLIQTNRLLYYNSKLLTFHSLLLCVNKTYCLKLLILSWNWYTCFNLTPLMTVVNITLSTSFPGFNYSSASVCTDTDKDSKQEISQISGCEFCGLAGHWITQSLQVELCKPSSFRDQSSQSLNTTFITTQMIKLEQSNTW